MLFCSNAVLRLIGFAYRAALLKSAGSETMGLYSLVMQIYAVVSAVCVYGSCPALTALAARTEGEETRPLLRASVKLLIVLWGFCAAVVMLFSKGIGAGVMHEPELIPSFVPLLACILLTGFENVFKAIHMGKGRFSLCAFSELAEQCIRFAAVRYLLGAYGGISGPEKVRLIICGMLISELFSVSVLGISFAAICPNKKASVKYNSEIGKRLRSAAFPSILTALAGTVFSSAGALLLPGALARSGMEREEALSLIGVFNNAALPLVMLPMAFVGAVAAVLSPKVSVLAARGNSPEKSVKKALAAAAAAGALSMLAAIVWGDRLSLKLFGASCGSSVLCPLAVFAFAAFLRTVCTASLNGMLMQKNVLYVTILTEAASLVMLLILTPSMGLAGHAAGLAVCECAGLIICLIILSNKWRRGMANTA